MKYKFLKTKSDYIIQNSYSTNCLKTVSWSKLATFAAQLIERWGMVAAIPDGEDSTGRQKLRLLTPSELIERSFEITKKFESKITEMGWVRETTEKDLEKLYNSDDTTT